MIVPMNKYSFLIFHAQYDDFLNKIQEIGVLHVIEKKINLTDDLSSKNLLINQFEKAIAFLKKREPEEVENKNFEAKQGSELLKEIIEKQNKQEELKNNFLTLNKEFSLVEPWGEFSVENIKKLEKKGILVKFYQCGIKKFDIEKLNEICTVEKISENSTNVFFVAISNDKSAFDKINYEEIKNLTRNYLEIRQEIEKTEQELQNIENYFDFLSLNSIESLEKAKNEIAKSTDYQKVKLMTNIELEGKVMLLEGWVPKTEEDKITDYLEKNNLVYLKERPTPDDKVPILLKNNRFARLFELIGSLFSLPSYTELDLTPFFAPFFMMFFGFCLGDAGYGLLFVIGAGLYKIKAKKELKPILSLVQWLGLSTIIFGVISGTLFGINLIDAKIPMLENVKDLFLNSDKMFKLALGFGGLQIVFGLGIKAANLIRMNGIKFALSTIGWLIVIIGSVVYVILTGAKLIPSSNAILYVILGLGGFFILFFSDPKASIPARIGKGIWDVYSTVTGIFGDILSYIRLFALGLSSAILGFVINDIGLQILGSGSVIGHILFVIFLLLGHTLNILISSLGSFVHPMRLTFVEFYKNAGFAGGGKEYKPFKSN